MADPDLARYAAELRRLGRRDPLRKAEILRVLFFDYALMPWQIRELTGVAEATTRLRCQDDPRYPRQADANRRRRRNPHHERWARLWRAQQTQPPTEPDASPPDTSAPDSATST